MYFLWLRTKQAFSLVELSIVLVILGLLAGGVLSGQALIRAAELRSVTADYQRYTAAIMVFRDKYFSFPGDMNNATQFWGSAGGANHTNDATCYSSITNDKRTCNGNGNGRLFFDDGVSDHSAPEWYRAWQQLANAGLIEGSYTGVADLAPRGATPGLNVPKGKISNTGFTLMSAGTTDTAEPNWWVGSYDGFAFGYKGYCLGDPTKGGCETFGIIFKPEEAWNIDTKLDDGRPATGLIRTWKGNGGADCNTTQDRFTAQYNLLNSKTVCGLFFAIQDPGN